MLDATPERELEVRARRFFCDRASCKRRIFCERLPEVAAHARKTRRRGAERWSTVRVPTDGASPFGRWVELSSAGRTDPENVRAALELSALAEAANISAREGRTVRPGELR